MNKPVPPDRVILKPTEPLRIGVVTVSDRASAGLYADRGGPAIVDYMSQLLASDWSPVKVMVPDEQAELEAELCRLVDQEGCGLICITGGTGPAPRDVTPEALEAVAEKMMPGFGEAMRAVSLTKVPTAILSRQSAGIRGQSLLITLPGNPKAIGECLDAVMPAVPYCLDLLGAPYLKFREGVLVAFRPKHAVKPEGVA